ncbi:phage terminase small subunit [Paenibacillus alvei]|uniref:Phage terminase small subunit n=1 Tax=Paenibacillus alvei TaxID=44250 RepID=A0ABT4H724_PAEAL|nr:phage terminase small subunit [Paenibacillus alvei]MCY9764791.1 phage terminase small subunit [Paenibacillus alvei]MCY9770698.1 phage terminase small subunit [Paenibacillus alvei]
MVEKHILAEQDYMQGLKYKEIAEKYDVTLNTVKSWKQRHGWQRNKGAPDQKGVHTKRIGAPDGNKNALGNEGGAPRGNQNAVTHGFFRKYLPERTLEIMEQVADRSPIDMLWDMIMIKYTAIIAAQPIMHVEGKEEMIKELKKRKYEVHNTGTKKEPKLEQFVTEEEYEFQFAWDRQATYLAAQSRAMSELRSLIRQYEDMCRQGLADEFQQLRISKLKAEVKALGENSSNDKPVIIDDIGGEDDGN